MTASLRTLACVALLGCGGGSSSSALPDAAAPIVIDAAPDALVLPACGPTPLPAPCAAAATAAPPSDGYGTDGAFAVVVETLANPHPTAPGDISVYRPAGQLGVPVMFFSHAFGATDPASYDQLLRHLASRGFAVVHVPYPLTPPVDAPNADRYDCLWQGFTTAVAAYPKVFDLTRVGFVGHSFGGGATPEMARRGLLDHGWGSAGAFMFIAAPWYSWGTDYDKLPTSLHTIVEVYADDEANDHQIAVHDVWNQLPAGMDKAWLMLRSDSLGGCGLNAPHVLPMTGQSATKNPEAVENSYDVWGVARRIDALAAHAFDHTAGAHDIAFGVDAAMGIWPDGRAVRPLEASTTTPITASCVTPAFREIERCANADPGVCP